MGVVGQFPLQDMMRRTIPGPVNPLDKSTVISIFPKEIREVKPTLMPGEWHILPGSVDNPSFLTVGPSSWWKDVGEEQPLIEIPVSSIQIADSIIKDYCNGYLGCNMDDAMPGMFFVPGSFGPDQLKTNKEYRLLFDKAKVKQTNFYRVLVRMADAYWSRTSGNPLAISDDMRLAARELNIQGRDWMADFNNQNDSIIRCVACGQMRNASYPVCPHCKAIVDSAKATELGIKFAQ
jgi:hypothetical protein